MDDLDILRTAGKQQFAPARNRQIAIPVHNPIQLRRKPNGGFIPFKGTPKNMKAVALRNIAVDLVAQFRCPFPPINSIRNRNSGVAFSFGRDTSIDILLSLADAQIAEIVEANPTIFPHFLRYNLNIWAERKVFNCEWDEHGTIDLVNFTRGPWEDLLIALASERLK